MVYCSQFYHRLNRQASSSEGHPAHALSCAELLQRAGPDFHTDV